MNILVGRRTACSILRSCTPRISIHRCYSSTTQTIRRDSWWKDDENKGAKNEERNKSSYRGRTEERRGGSFGERGRDYKEDRENREIYRERDRENNRDSYRSYRDRARERERDTGDEGGQTRWRDRDNSDRRTRERRDNYAGERSRDWGERRDRDWGDREEGERVEREKSEYKRVVRDYKTTSKGEVDEENQDISSRKEKKRGVQQKRTATSPIHTKPNPKQEPPPTNDEADELTGEDEPYEPTIKEKQRSYVPYFPLKQETPSERKTLLLFKEKNQFTKHQWILPHQVVGQGFEYAPGDLVDVYSVDEHLLGQAYVNPMSKIFGRFVSWAPNTVEKLDEAYFETKIREAYERRKRITTDESGDFLYGRLVNSEGDFLPGVIIERYGSVFVVQTKTLAMDVKFPDIITAITNIFQTTLVIERNDFASRGAEGLKQVRAMHVPEFDSGETTPSESGEATPSKSGETTPPKSGKTEAEAEAAKLGNEDQDEENASSESTESKDTQEESGGRGPAPNTVISFAETHSTGVSAKFKVDILRGQKTGYYFDQAFNRSLLSGMVTNKTVLDLYCYVGSWSIFAKKYGAKSCLGVDASSLAIQHAEQNAELNSLQGLKWRIGDVEEVLDSLIKEKRQFDVIVIDPPALVPKKKHFFQGFKKYLEIHQKAFSILPPGGIIYSCSCSYHMGVEQHLEFLQKAAEQSNKNITILAKGGLPADHPVDVFTPESDYLTCYVVQVW